MFGRKNESPIKNSRKPNLAFIGLFVLIGTASTALLLAAPNEKALQNGFQGDRAIEKLGDKLPDVAKGYGLKPEELKRILTTDDTARIDGKNQLYYSDKTQEELEKEDDEHSHDNPQQAISTNEKDNQAASTITELDLASIFKLHSLPGASKVIYLDFDGHTTKGTSWNSSFTSGADIVSPPYSEDSDVVNFSDKEKSIIISAWKRVAEDFAPFGVDVTTEDPGVDAIINSGTGDTKSGQRIVITSSSSWYGGAGGVAYYNTFATAKDTPGFVFNTSLDGVAEAISHETGHTLGLAHDGYSLDAYYYGSDSLWAPIMGISYYSPISQWSKGEYYDANNKEDDLAKIGTKIGYKTDDVGNTLQVAKDMTTNSSTDYIANGIIEKSDDVDVFAFTTTNAGPVRILARPVSDLDSKIIQPNNIVSNTYREHEGTNLDIKIRVLDSSGNVLAEADPQSAVLAATNVNVPSAGKYFIEARSTGFLNPLIFGYTSYGSVGSYVISAQIGNNTALPTSPTVKVTSSVDKNSAPANLKYTIGEAEDPATCTTFVQIYTRSKGNTAGATNWSLFWAKENSGDARSTLTKGSETYRSLIIARANDARVECLGPYSYQEFATTLDSSLPPADTVAPVVSVALNGTNLYGTVSGNANIVDDFGFDTYSVSCSIYDGDTLVNNLGRCVNSVGKIRATLPTLVAGKSYKFRILANDKAGNKSQPADANFTFIDKNTDTTKPNSPTGLKAYNVTNTRAKFSWTESTDNSTTPTYEVYRNGVLFSNAQSFAQIRDGFFIAENLAPGTSYSFYVVALDGNGNRSAASNTISIKTTGSPPVSTGDTVAPSAPSGLALVSKTDTSVSISWSASTDNIGVVGYDITRNGVALASTSNTSYTNTGLQPGTSYSYVIRAKDAAGNISTPSITLTITTNVPPPPPADTVAPTAPASLTASTISTSQINLSWSASSDNVAVTGYDVYRNGVKLLTTTSTTFGDTGLTQNTTYNYYIKAKDAAGNISVASSTATATTKELVIQQTSILSGKITNNSAIQISGARISLVVNGIKISTTSNNFGDYRISGIPVSPYSVTYGAKRYKSQTVGVLVVQPETVQNIILQPNSGNR